MVDAPSRKKPRFPASCEEAARLAIREAITSELDQAQASGLDLAIKIGIAGGACGGDILFHEECIRAGITPYMFLVFPRDMFTATSVSFAGQEWVRRFNALYSSLNEQDRVFTQDSTTPVPFSSDAALSIWERNNEWMLENALAYKAARTTLIALWNGEGANAPGGTSDMVTQAQARGAHNKILDTNQLC